MKLVSVGITPVFRVTCCRCSLTRHTDQAIFYADVDGVAWRDYYCQDCAKALDKTVATC